MASTLIINAVLLTLTTVSDPRGVVNTVTHLLIAATLVVCAARLRVRDTRDDGTDRVTVT